MTTPGILSSKLLKGTSDNIKKNLLSDESQDIWSGWGVQNYVSAFTKTRFSTWTHNIHTGKS